MRKQPTVPAVLYDQIQRHGSGIVDLQVDHRGTWRTTDGGFTRTAGGGVPGRTAAPSTRAKVSWSPWPPRGLAALRRLRCRVYRLILHGWSVWPAVSKIGRNRDNTGPQPPRSPTVLGSQSKPDQASRPDSCEKTSGNFSILPISLVSASAAELNPSNGIPRIFICSVKQPASEGRR